MSLDGQAIMSIHLDNVVISFDGRRQGVIKREIHRIALKVKSVRGVFLSAVNEILLWRFNLDKCTESVTHSKTRRTILT